MTSYSWSNTDQLPILKIVNASALSWPNDKNAETKQEKDTKEPNHCHCAVGVHLAVLMGSVHRNSRGQLLSGTVKSPWRFRRIL